MGTRLQFHHRKLIEYSVNKTATDICASACNLADNSTFCKSPCLFFCPNYCQHYLESLIPSQGPVVIIYDYHPSKSLKFLIIIVLVLSTTLFALLLYVIFVKFYSGWQAGSRRRSSASSQPQIENEIHDGFLDHEDHGPVVDHHVWYINTVGLQPSIISAITVCKYKKGDGLVEGTVCSVCLSEFQDNETLRLLPNCCHAFHVSCIDTWLRSHTNCPMCRAPIVKNAALALSSESNNENSGTNENTQVSVLVNNGETERELEDGVVDEGEVQLELTRKRIENSDDQIHPIRRSVSLDCVSISKMIQGIANFVSEETIGNSDTKLAEDMKMDPKKVGRTESLRKFVGSSSIERSFQNTQFSLKRSSSCNAKFLFSRPT